MFRFLCGVLVLAASTSSVQAQEEPAFIDLLVVTAAKAHGDVKVVIKNQGRAAAGACRMSIKVFNRSGKQVSSRTVNVPKLAGGAAVTLSPRVGDLDRGHRVEIVVDSTRVLRERFTTNNARAFLIPNAN